MKYLALASDFDGTLAQDGRVDAETLRAVERLRHSGRKMILVTGRQLHELLDVFPESDRCDWVVAENGALLYQPTTQQIRLLAEPPPEAFLHRLRERGVGPISAGRVIVATWEPHQAEVLGAIHDLGLELQVIFNKGAVMVLPTGVNKATGLAAALELMGLSPASVVGVGDAENDHAFLNFCGFSVAVGNALPAIVEEVDLVTQAGHGAGVCQLIEELLADDLASRAHRARLS